MVDPTARRWRARSHGAAVPGATLDSAVPSRYVGGFVPTVMVAGSSGLTRARDDPASRALPSSAPAPSVLSVSSVVLRARSGPHRRMQKGTFGSLKGSACGENGSAKTCVGGWRGSGDPRRRV